MLAVIKNSDVKYGGQKYKEGKAYDVDEDAIKAFGDNCEVIKVEEPESPVDESTGGKKGGGPAAAKGKGKGEGKGKSAQPDEDNAAQAGEEGAEGEGDNAGDESKTNEGGSE